MVFTVTYDPVPNIKLVKAVEKYPVLYNTVSHYPYRKSVDEAWEKVAEEVNDTNVCCKERWLNLRNSYKRFLRQKRSNTVKKPYYLAEHMEFLEPFIVLGGPRSDNKIKKADGENVSDTEASLPDKDDDDDDYEMSIDYLDQSSNGTGDLVINESAGSSTSSKPVAKTTNMMAQTSAAQTSITYGLRQENTPEENFCKNHDLAFFVSLLPEVRAMTEEQKERFKKEIVDTIDNILYAEDLSDF